MGKKYTLDELTNVARTATLQALSEYTVPESMKIDLVAGVIFGDEHYVGLPGFVWGTWKTGKFRLCKIRNSTARFSASKLLGQSIR